MKKLVKDCAERQLINFCAYYKKPCSECPLFLRSKNNIITCYFNADDQDKMLKKYLRILDKNIDVEEMQVKSDTALTTDSTPVEVKK